MTPLEQQVYSYLRGTGDTDSSRIIAKKLGVSKDMILKVRNMVGDMDKIERLQELIAPKLVNITHFTGDSIISADHHNPCADLRIVRAICESAREHKIKRLIDAGDFFNFDALSGFARKIYGDAKLPKITDELDVGNEVLKLYSKYFDEIYLLEGNHEQRFARCVSNQLSYETIVKSLAFEKVKLINNNFVYLDEIRLTHPRSYSQIKMSVAKRLTTKFMEPVLQAHGHFGTWGFADNGLKCGDIPCVCDPDRISYLQGGDTTHPFWNQGFIIYKDKQLYPRAKGWGLDI